MIQPETRLTFTSMFVFSFLTMCPFAHPSTFFTSSSSGPPRWKFELYIDSHVLPGGTGPSSAICAVVGELLRSRLSRSLPHWWAPVLIPPTVQIANARQAAVSVSLNVGVCTKEKWFKTVSNVRFAMSESVRRGGRAQCGIW
jgi:hypothetical protein